VSGEPTLCVQGQNKLHIQEFWSAGGLDLKLPIDRCELKLESSRHLTGFSLTPEHWTRSYISAFFRSRTEDYFLFKNTKGGIKSIIDFKKTDQKNEYFSKRVYNSPNTLYGIKTTIRVLHNEIGIYPSGEVIAILLKKYRLKSWYEKSRKRW
jgi:hypothetical protein